MTDFFFLPPVRIAEIDAPRWDDLEKYVAKKHASASTRVALTNVYKELKKLHTVVCRVTAAPDSAEEIAVDETLRRYAFLVQCAMAHFSLRDQKPLEFRWTLTPPGVFPKRKVESTDPAFHLASLLSVAGTLLCRLASKAVADGTADGAKKGFKLMQAAAGAAKAAESYSKNLSDEARTEDLSAAGSHALKKLYLAYAHYCAVLNVARRTPEKYSLLSSLSASGYDILYAASACARKAEGARMYDPRPDGRSMADSAALGGNIMLAHAHFNASMALMNETDAGTAVAHANEAVSVLLKCSASKNAVVQQFLDEYKQHFARCKRENEMVYRRQVPADAPTLTRSPSVLGKPIDFLSGESANYGVDPFIGVVPPSVMKTVNKFREEAQLLLSQRRESCTIHWKRVQESLSSLGVTAVLNALDAEAGDNAAADPRGAACLPREIRELIVTLRNEARDTYASVNSLVAPQRPFDVSKGAPAGDHEGGKAMEFVVDTLELTGHANDECFEIINRISKSIQEAEDNDAKWKANYGEKLWVAECKPLEEVERIASCKRAVEKLKGVVQSQLYVLLEELRRELLENIDEHCKLDLPISELAALFQGESQSHLIPCVKTEGPAECARKIRGRLDNIKKLDNDIKERLEGLRHQVEGDELTAALSAAPETTHSEVVSSCWKAVHSELDAVSAVMTEEDADVSSIESIMNSHACGQSTDPSKNRIAAACMEIERSATFIRTAIKKLKNLVTFAVSTKERLLAMERNLKDAIAEREEQAQKTCDRIDKDIACRINEMEQKKSVNF